LIISHHHQDPLSVIKTWLTVTWLFALCIARGQSVSTFMSARASGMGNAFSCLQDEWSVFNNIGGLTGIKKTTAAFSYDAQPSLKAANKMAAVLALPLKTGTAGFGIFKFGDDLYNEQVLSTGYSSKFGLASLGVKVNYIQYYAEGFGTKGVFSFSFGGIARLTSQLAIGAHITNVNQPKLSALENEHIPTLLNAGISFTPSEKIFITTEVEKDLDYKATWKTGLEYKAQKKICFRTGFNLYPAAGFFGVGFRPKKFTLDYAFRYQPTVGGGHQASIAYTFN